MLVPAPEMPPSDEAMLAAYACDVRRYGGPPLRQLWSYRVCVTWALLPLFVGEQIVVATVVHLWRAMLTPLPARSIVGWSAVGAWL